MKFKYPEESDAYNKLIINVNNSNILAPNILTLLNQKIMHCMNLCKKAVLNKLSYKEMLKNDTYLEPYNDLKLMFSIDIVLSDKYKKYILENIKEAMKQKHIKESEFYKNHNQ